MNSNLNDSQIGDQKNKTPLMGTYKYSTDDLLDKDILELMGAKDIPPEEKAELYNSMNETIMNRVIMRIDDALTDEEAKEWKTIVDSGDKEKNEEFLKTKGINLDELFMLEALVYKTQMVDLATKSGVQPKVGEKED